MNEHIFYTEHVPGGSSWSARLHRGLGLRITDPTGDANAALCLWSARDSFERLNLPDTLKSQRLAHLAAPCTLQSDMGHVLASLVEDSCGWHDILGGLGDREHAVAKYGDGITYQKVRNGRLTCARDHFLTELGKYGLGERDLTAVINLFSRVAVKDDGTLAWESHPQSGRSVTLRFEMDTLAVLSATPHPLDPGTAWLPRDLELEIIQMAAPGPDDAVRLASPESGRALELTERLHLGVTA